MKRIFFILAAVLMAASAWADGLMPPKVVFYKNLSKYKYVYVIPTSAITSNSGVSGDVYGGSYGVFGGVYGGPTKTVNPSDEISGQLIKRGYTILPSVDPALIKETMVVSYGNAGTHSLSAFSYATAIVLQFTDASTHEKLAIFQTEGCGSDETEDIRQAINLAFEVYDQGLYPYVKLSIEDVTRSDLLLTFYNRTPKDVTGYKLRIIYYKDNEIVHEQQYSATTSLSPGESEDIVVKRDKKARSSKLAISAKIVSYEQNK